jgi:hypothetical protein
MNENDGTGIRAPRRPRFPFAYPRPTIQDIVLMGAALCITKAELPHGEFIGPGCRHTVSSSAESATVSVLENRR